MWSFNGISSVMVAVLAFAASASAATWDPQNTVVHGDGNLSLTSGSGVVSCTVTLYAKASSSVATTTTPAGVGEGPTFTNCTNNIGLTPTVVASDGDWRATATGTTSVDLVGSMLIEIGGGMCQIVADFSIANNTWSNTAHRLTANAVPTFPIIKGGFCPLMSSTAYMNGSIVFPSSVVIT